jgi:citrate lyase synthetase
VILLEVAHNGLGIVYRSGIAEVQEIEFRPLALESSCRCTYAYNREVMQKGGNFYFFLDVITLFVVRKGWLNNVIIVFLA